jgi:hypothetical protein
MKSLRALSLTLFVAIICVTASAYAEEPKTSGYASVDVMSNYVWRGQKLSNSVVVQPSVGITYGGFGANLWANFDTDRNEANTSGGGHGEGTETDYTLNYSFAVNKFNLSAGYIYYALEGVNDTEELYFSAGYDTILKPTLAVYYDFDEGNGAFIVASIGHSFEVAKGINWNLGASAGYNINNKVMGFDKDGDEFSNFYNAEFSTSLNIPVWKAISITPKFAYSLPLSNDAREAIKNISDDGDKEIFYGGINITLSF